MPSRGRRPDICSSVTAPRWRSPWTARAGRIATTIEGPADAAALVLSGERTDGVTITGEDWPLALLRKWIKRAQSG